MRPLFPILMCAIALPWLLWLGRFGWKHRRP